MSTSNQETLKKFYAAMEQHDWETKRGMLHDDFQFRGPLMQVEGADQFIQAIKQFGCEVKFADVEMLEKGSTVMSFFTFQISQPFEGAFRMAERVTIEDGKLRASELIF